MHYFNFKKNNLYCEEFKVEDLAKQYGTPLYIYSSKTILEHFSKLEKAFEEIKPLICYSVKANSNLSFLKLLTSQGSGLDIVSGGELYRAKKIKCPGNRIVYASVGKTDKEIEEALNYNILMFNAESVPELKRINSIAKTLNKKADVALRVNPDVEPNTHKYITTGKKENKFGIDMDTAKDIFLKSKKFSNLKIIGIHIHIGSQITDGEPFVNAIQKIQILIEYLKNQGVKLEYLNIGGGLGIVYDNETPQTAREFADKILPLLKQISLKLILEPGRFIAGNSGILVSKVTYIKDTPQKKFVIVDAAMNDLARPSLYSAYHNIVALKNHKNKIKNIKKSDVVGAICESGDFLGKDRDLDVKAGEYIAVLGAGAYGFSMSSNYNSRPRTAEILVKDKKTFLIRKRETYNDLVKEEIII